MQRLTADVLKTETQAKVLGQPMAVQSALIDPARVEAERVQEQQTSIFEQARQQGYAEGMKEAEREIQKRVEEIENRLTQSHQKTIADLEAKKQLLNKMAVSVKTAIKKHADEAEQVAVEVAFASVLRLLGEKSADRSMMLELCHAVANEYGHGAAVLRISDADSSIFESIKMGLEIEVDRRLKSGECVIETTRGQFACGIDVRLEALKKAFISGLHQHREVI